MMAWQVYDFALTLPTGTSKSSLSPVQDMTMPRLIVRRIHLRIPPGPRGEVGFYIGAAANQVLPATPGSFVITDNAELDWEIENKIDTGSWEFVGYNTGSYAHTIYVRFFGDPVASVSGLTLPIFLPSIPLYGSVSV